MKPCRTHGKKDEAGATLLLKWLSWKTLSLRRVRCLLSKSVAPVRLGDELQKRLQPVEKVLSKLISKERHMVSSVLRKLNQSAPETTP
jgi:hypothetical protein